MPTRTSVAVALKAAERFKFLDVISFPPFCFVADSFGRCADHRRHSEIARFLAHRKSAAGPLLAKKQIAFNPGSLTSRTLMAHTAK
jgi:hypothetical protein